MSYLFKRETKKYEFLKYSIKSLQSLTEDTILDLQSNHNRSIAHGEHVHYHIVLNPFEIAQKIDNEEDDNKAKAGQNIERLPKDGQQQNLKCYHMYHIPKSTSDFREQALHSHVNNQAPSL